MDDALGRPLDTLRISVTDRCNFRCTYCMPKAAYGDHVFLHRRDLLTLEEVARLAGVFAQLGVRTVRLTGGEPLLRRNLEHLVALLAAIPGLEVALTTNGALLADKVEALAQAGLDRVNVSLDSVDDTAFRALNDVDFAVAGVFAGIDAALAAGLPVKVNAVVKRSPNDDGVVALARRFRGTDVPVRFIEYMDVGRTNGWQPGDVVPADEIVSRIDSLWPLEQLDPAGTARRYRYRDGAGEIGVIASVTQPFCSRCSRARLSADGRLYTCLFGLRGHDLRALIRAGARDDELASVIGEVWDARADRYSELRAAGASDLAKVEMSYIGG
jgi:GTP 3',8-cyclase